MRTLAVGDIHGNLSALEALLHATRPEPDDCLVLLGDYIDRGPDSNGVVSCVLELTKKHHVIALRGNHEVMMLAARGDPLQANLWRSYGGDDLLRSYGDEYRPDWQQLIPAEHWAFIESTRPWFETNTHIFVHGTVLADVDVQDQPEHALFWGRLDPSLRHKSGKIVVCGHTPQPSGWPVRGDHVICLDSGAGHGGWLTAMDMDSGRVWQANDEGATRTGEPQRVI